MGARTKTAKYAVGFTFGAFALILIAFSTPYWLQTDGELTHPKFTNLGNWRISFSGVVVAMTSFVCAFRIVGDVPARFSGHSSLLRRPLPRLHVDLRGRILHHTRLHPSAVLHRRTVLLHLGVHAASGVGSADAFIPDLLEGSRALHPPADHERLMLGGRGSLRFVRCDLVRLLW